MKIILFIYLTLSIVLANANIIPSVSNVGNMNNNCPQHQMLVNDNGKNINSMDCCNDVLHSNCTLKLSLLTPAIKNQTINTRKELNHNSVDVFYQSFISKVPTQPPSINS